MIKDYKKKKKCNKILIIFLLLLFFILLTSIILILRIDKFSKNDENTIYVFEEIDLSINDDNKEWKTENEIEIFKSSYDKLNDNLLLESSNEDKIIAPGVSNNYTFNLKNTGNLAVDYSIKMEAILKINDEKVDLKDFPVLVRIKNNNDEYFLGNSQEWLPIENINSFIKESTLKIKNYANYIFEWKWQAENSNNIDTKLGMLAQNDDIDLTIKIITTSTPTTNEENNEPEQEESAGIPVFKEETTNNKETSSINIIIILIIAIIIVSYLLIRKYIQIKKDNSNVEE